MYFNDAVGVAEAAGYFADVAAPERGGAGGRALARAADRDGSRGLRGRRGLGWGRGFDGGVGLAVGGSVASDLNARRTGTEISDAEIVGNATSAGSTALVQAGYTNAGGLVQAVGTGVAVAVDAGFTFRKLQGELSAA